MSAFIFFLLIVVFVLILRTRFFAYVCLFNLFSVFF